MAVQAQGQSLSQRLLLKRFSTTQQRDVSDFGGWTNGFLQLSGLSVLVEGVVLVFVDRG